MFAKVDPPNKSAGNNAGSCANLMEYLDKESRLLGEDHGSTFFNLDRERIFLGEAIAEIDSTNSKMGKGEAKFFHVHLSPSEREQRHLLKMITGREVGHVSELAPEERARYEAELRDFTNKAMDIYAMNFNKGLRADDLVYAANIEHRRTWNHRDKAVIKNKNITGELTRARRELENLKNPGPRTARLRREIEELRARQWRTKSGHVPVSLKDSKTCDANMGLLEEKQHIASEINDRGMDTKDIFDQAYKDMMSDSDKALFSMYYAINKEIVFVSKDKQSRILTVRQLRENDALQKEIDACAYLLDYFGGADKSKIDNIEQSIARMEAALERDNEGKAVQQGMPKKGLQSHVHIVVSRRTKKLADEKGERTRPPVKISPNAKSRGHSQRIAGKQTNAKIGFDHERFKKAVNELFRQKYAYSSQGKESYSGSRDTGQSVAAKGVAMAQSQGYAVVSQTFGSEHAKAVAHTQEAVQLAKAAMAGPKSLGANVLRKLVRKPLKLLKVEFKAIVTGKVLGG